MTTTDCLLQFLNRHNQLCDGFLQPCYHILAVLKGSLLKTWETLKVHHPVLQEKDLLQATIDPVVCRLPLLREDHVVLLDGILDPVGSGQDLLAVLLGICLDPTDLGSMGSPFMLSIVHLETRKTLVGHQTPYVHFSHLGFQFNILGRKRSTIGVPCWIACVAWWRHLLGAFQSRTPIWRRDNRAGSLIFVQSTTQSHSAP